MLRTEETQAVVKGGDVVKGLANILCQLGLHHWWLARIGTGDGGAICIHSCEWCAAKRWEYRAGGC